MAASHFGRGNPPQPCFHNKILTPMRGTKFQQPFARIILVPLSPEKIILQKTTWGRDLPIWLSAQSTTMNAQKCIAPQALKAPPPFRIKGSMMYKKNWKTCTLNVLFEWNAKRLTPRGEPLKQWTIAKWHPPMAHFSEVVRFGWTGWDYITPIANGNRALWWTRTYRIHTFSIYWYASAWCWMKI